MKRTNRYGIIIVILVLAVMCHAREKKQLTNSVGMRLLRIESGSFEMGSSDGNPKTWDEEPTHQMTISQPFYISETEVTVEQYRRFRPEFTGSMTEGPYAVGLSWHEAVAFCAWLSRIEGKNYRLPTETEWEYAARAGTDSPFWSGDTPPEPGATNPWGLKNMHSGPLEWIHDWYGPYPLDEQIDPVGPNWGVTRVVRGGGLDRKIPFYARSRNRASYGAAFSMMEGSQPELLEENVKVSTDPTQEGLIGVWYGTATFDKAKAVEHLTFLDMDWHDFQQPGEDRETMWSARWEGTIIGPACGEVTFHVASDFGVKLDVAGQTVLDWEGLDSKRSGTISMEKGKRYPVFFEYIHSKGERSYMTVTWSWEGQEETAVPTSHLFHSSAQSWKMKRIVPRVYQPGHHSIGFRVVQAGWPNSEPYEQQRPFIQDCVAQEEPMAEQGPDPEIPWYRRRTLLPIPPTDMSWKESWEAGFPKGFWPHIHNSAVEICSNGDMLVSHYTAPLGHRGEDQPEVYLIGSRLRFGARDWDMPEFFQVFADANTTSPCFYREGDAIHFYSGHTFYDRHYPFQWVTSHDNGATWSEPRFPQVIGEVGPHTPQPINSVFRGLDRTLYIATDGYGSTSLLWASKDDGRTWRDTGGRTMGRHTTFEVLKDGRILGIGGKKADIDGFNPQSISDDGGKTWTFSKTPFSEMGGNQRPSLIRLQSGRLFICGDFQHKTGRYPEAIKERGSYVALSDDEGETWHIKKLAGGETHFEDNRYETIGYSVAKQGPNGIIHIIATCTLPILHYEINEAWILDEDAEWSLLYDPVVEDVKEHTETYPSGKLKSVRRGGVTKEGQYLLDGEQVWYYESGQKQWQVVFEAGRKVGQETFWNKNGSVAWGWYHKDDGSSIWTQYWPDGQKKAESEWRNYKAEGQARRWDVEGDLISNVYFWNGRKL